MGFHKAKSWHLCYLTSTSMIFQPLNPRKYRYADDLAILLSNSSWSRVERGLSHDMTALSSYLKNWRLMLIVPETISASFHLNNRQAKRQLNITVDNNRLQFQNDPHIPQCKARKITDFQRTPSWCEEKNFCSDHLNLPPSWNNVGSCYEDTAIVNPGPGILCRRVLCPCIG